MVTFAKESLQVLREKIDLIEVLSSHMKLKRMGGYYKACCPFHSEKTPSFTVQRGDSHYHCFGCGAHGDAIAFLMNFMKLSFTEAVETLAERFKVTLDRSNGKDDGPKLAPLREVMNQAADLYHFYLLHTDEGYLALKYLYSRGLDLDFIRTFKVGLAPKSYEQFFKPMAKCLDELLQTCGLVTYDRNNRKRPFFSERVVFPIMDVWGNTIGFSARKLKEEAFGPKYINTPETPLFKKSKTLFGLNHCRKRISKERKALIVEGQIDALRLIQEGLNFTVAGQGTAFGEGHVEELIRLGVNHVFLGFDNDNAGNEAAVKVGHLFQKQAIEVSVINFPEGGDPDKILLEKGVEAFLQLLDDAKQYIPFLVEFVEKEVNIKSPAGKNELIRKVSSKIREWEHPLMIHEGLKTLANLMQVPESIVNPDQSGGNKIHIKHSGSINQISIDPDRVLETDLLRWLILHGQGNLQLVDIVEANLVEEDFQVPICRQIYTICIEQYKSEQSLDLLSLVARFDDTEQRLFLSEILQKKVNPDRARDDLVDTIRKILQRNWMQKREEIRSKIQAGKCSEEELLALAKMFDAIKKSPPQVIV